MRFSFIINALAATDGGFLLRLMLLLLVIGSPAMVTP